MDVNELLPVDYEHILQALLVEGYGSQSNEARKPGQICFEHGHKGNQADSINSEIRPPKRITRERKNSERMQLRGLQQLFQVQRG